MKRIVIERQKKEKLNIFSEIITAIHNLAKYNGSKHTINISYIKNKIYIFQNCANSDFTVGYFAILYLIDSTPSEECGAFTCPGDGGWFSVKIKDEQKFLNFLKL